MDRGSSTSPKITWYFLVIPILCSLTATYFLYPEGQVEAYSYLRVLPSAKPDLGSLGWGDTAVRIKLENSSQQRVSLRHLFLHCDCTSTNFKPQDLAPGDIAEIQMNWNTIGRDGPATTTLDVYYSVAEHGEPAKLYSIPIELRATITPDYRIEPKEITFIAGETKKATVRLMPLPKCPPGLHLVGAASNHSAFHATLLGDNAEIEFDSSLWENRPSETAWMNLATTHSHHPRYQIPLKVVSQK